MFVNFLRKNVYAAGVLALFRIYLGWEFLKAGWEKLAGPEPFDARGFLVGAAKKAVGEHPAVPGWWADFLNGFAIPNAGFFNFLIPWGELLVGIAMIAGIFTTFAALMGIIMNFAFLFSGSTSTNTQMVLLAIFVLVAGANAGKFGLDYYVLPYLKKYTGKTFARELETKAH
ncbi:MAG TPA: DoxX family protein [Bacilli bacterium]